MAIRAKNRALADVQRRMKSMEKKLIAISFVLAGCGIAATLFIVQLANVEQFFWAPISWILLAVAIPVIAINRTRQYTLLSFSHEVEARNVLLAITIAALAVYLVLVFLKLPTVLASVSALSELSAMVYFRLQSGPLHSRLEISE